MKLMLSIELVGFWQSIDYFQTKKDIRSCSYHGS